MVTVLLAVYVGLMLLHTVNMGRDCIKHKDDLGKGIGSSQGLLVLLLTFWIHWELEVLRRRHCF